MATLSQAYLEWEQKTRQQGLAQGATQEARSLVLRLLRRRLGSFPDDLSTRLETLAIAQLEALAEDLLEFGDLSDLEDWLSRQDNGAGGGEHRL